jgi:hypothetical protein
MPKQADGSFMSHIQYAEILVSKVLEFNQTSKKAKKIRKNLLLNVCDELQAEMMTHISDDHRPSK